MLITNGAEAMLSEIYFPESLYIYIFIYIYVVDGVLVVLLVYAESSERHYRPICLGEISLCVSLHTELDGIAQTLIF